MKTLYSVLFITLNISLNAQPVLTQTNSSPVIGENYTLSRINWDNNPGTSGANQVWDFSNITVTQTNPINYVSPSTCPSNSSFPTANLSIDYNNGSYYHYNSSSNVYEIVGLYGSNVAIPYSNPEKLLNYPFTFNNTFVDSFAASFVSNSIAINRLGSVTVLADGYGTLILPNATITNVLRVKVTENYGDYYASSGTQFGQYSTEIYMFYKPNFHYPALSLTHFVQNGQIVNYGNFIDDPSLFLDEIENDDEISIYPNPCTNLININWSTITDIKKISIYDVYGKSIYVSTSKVNTIDLNEFSKGIYFIHIWKGDKRIIKQIIKQ